MAVELATAYVSIVPSAKGILPNLRRELKPLEDEGTNIGDRTARNFGRTFTAGVGAAATKGAVVLAGGFTLAAGIGLKIAADFEQTQIAFEGILGSADEAKSVLGDLREFAAKTPFEFTGLTESAQQLLGVGFGAEDLIPTLSTLGDVAATLGAGEPEIRGVVRALGQIKGKGKVSAEELQQISEQLPGFSAIEAIAKGLGITTAEAFEQMAKGAIPADEGITAILEGMETFPGASGAMERQSKTLNGVISNLKDTLATTAIDFITPYLPAISSGVTAFGGFIQNSAVPALEDFIDFITETVGPGISDLIDVFQEKGLGGALSQVGETISNFVETQGPGLLTALGEFVQMIGDWAANEGLDMIGDGLRVLIPAWVRWITEDVIPAITDALPGVAAAIAAWALTELLPGLIGLGIDIAAAILDGIGEGLTNAGGWAVELARELANALIRYINTEIIDALNDALEFDFKVRGIGFTVDAPDLPHIPQLAKGGVLTAGQMAVVGDGGKPELFVPSVDGTVLPEVPAGLGGSGFRDLHVHGTFGEDPVDKAFREARRMSMLVA